MNQKELSELSAVVERRQSVRRLLQEWEEGSDAPATPEQRQAIRQLVQEKAEDYARLEEALRRLSEQLERMEERLSAGDGGEATVARVRRLQQHLQDVGESMERLRATIQPMALGELHTAALMDPYAEESAPAGRRVRVPEGDL